LIFLGFLLPLAVYLLILALLNRGQHPVLVPGTWDCAGLLLASSGFLLLGGPAVLTGFYEEWRLTWLLGQTRLLRGLGESWSFWVGLWMSYFVLVIAGAAWLLASRRCLTSIYNVEPAAFQDALRQVLDRTGLEWALAGANRLMIRWREPAADNQPLESARLEEYSRESVEAVDLSGRGPGNRSVAQVSPDDGVMVSFEPFAALRHMTLRWSSPSAAVRREVEAELGRTLQTIYTADNPAGRWFMSCAVSLFLVCLFALAGLIAIRFIRLLR
jgi:hypothetical protein